MPVIIYNGPYETVTVCRQCGKSMRPQKRVEACEQCGWVPHRGAD